MHFLSGERIYIKPKKACGALDEQLQQCLNQLSEINTDKEIFKLNFFVDTPNANTYQQVKSLISEKVSEQFSKQILKNLIAQPPLTCKIIVEAFFFDPSVWTSKFIQNRNDAAILFQSGQTEVLIGNVQSNDDLLYGQQAEAAFSSLSNLFDEVNFSVSSIVRQWNYLEDIVGFEGEKQKYQEFNNVRSKFYADSFKETGYPAATGIGMNEGGIIIEFVAVKSSEAISRAINNPDQVAAHNYSEDVLVGEEAKIKTTPKFERARYFELFDKKLMFISGTASITGEKTIGVGDPVKQTEVTINNIRKLYSEQVLQELSNSKLQPKYGHSRVYLKNREDFHAIRSTFKKHFGNLPVVYILADICRDELLVEIEGKVILG